jgi:hypothetical protein
LLGGVSAVGPFAGLRATVGGFGAVVETVCPAAGFAAKGKEVELVAVLILAVAADRLEVFVRHLGEGFRGGTAITFADGDWGHGRKNEWVEDGG